MIIGFDASRAFTSKPTGTENYSYQLLKALAKFDNKNSYIVYLRPHSVAFEQNWPNNFTFKVINWPRLWTQGGLALQTFKDKLDLLFVPAHTLPIIRKSGLKTVVTVHDLGSEYLPQMHQLKQRLYLSHMQRYQLKSATKLIAVSKATKNDLVNKIGITPEKIEVIYEGWDKNKFKIQNSKFKIDVLINNLKQYDLVPGKYFLFVGTVQPRKNPERLILAFSKFLGRDDTGIRQDLRINKSVINHQSLKLVIVGRKGWLADEIYKLPKKLGIEDRVKFLGYVPNEDMPALYKGAIALTFPSLFEGFGLPILEAQACGCPVITSNVSSMPEVAGKGAVYVNPYLVDDIVEGMEKVQSVKCKVPWPRSAKRGGQSVKAGYENIKRFSWEKCASQTLKVFQNL